MITTLACYILYMDMQLHIYVCVLNNNKHMNFIALANAFAVI